MTVTACFYTQHCPKGLREQLSWIKKQYGDVEVFITENGVSTAGNLLKDVKREDFIRSHLEQVGFTRNLPLWFNMIKVLYEGFITLSCCMRKVSVILKSIHRRAVSSSSPALFYLEIMSNEGTQIVIGPCGTSFNMIRASAFSDLICLRGSDGPLNCPGIGRLS